MRLLVCGDRNWTDRNLILKTIKSISYGDIELLVHGGARGADRLAGSCARELGITTKSVRADWSRYGRAAGPIRNQKMLGDHKPTVALAFHDDIENSKGTADMVRRLRKANIPVKVIGD